jgi:hypothetical protein
VVTLPITQFDGPYLFLSNFSPSRLVIDEIQYPMVEHPFQALKTFDRAKRLEIAAAPNPSRAKYLGRCLELRPDWEQVKVPIMLLLLRKKFGNAHLARCLLATGDAPLIEDTTRRRRPDVIWGARWDGQQWIGTNYLGRCLEKVRRDIRNGTPLPPEKVDEMLLKLSRPQGVAA